MPDLTCAQCTHTPPDPVRVAKARLGANVRHHPERDHTENRRDLAAAKLAAYVQKIVDEAPPLTDAQAQRIAALLLAGGAA